MTTYYVVSGEKAGQQPVNCPSFDSLDEAFRYARRNAMKHHYGLEVVDEDGQVVDEYGERVD